MASESEASCEEDPNFAVICAFFEKFGTLIGITDIDFCELQSMLENTHEVSQHLIELHIKLLRKIKRTVSPPDRWEKSLIKFCHTFSSLDAWELERFGYKNAKLTSKVRILKELLEAQFDQNSKFKVEINKLASKELRSTPIGRDKCGHAYWFQSDDNYQIRVYKEDLDDEKWTLVAKDRTGLVSLISTLSDGDIKLSSDSAGNEDSNSLSEKPIIDTGQQDTDSKKTSEDEDSNLDKDGDQPKEGAVLEKIETLTEQMPSPKRPREEEEPDESIFQKYKIKNLEVVVSDIAKDTVQDDAAEEPATKVEDEQELCADNKSPIVGETIEEETRYVQGNGSGNDCETGNQPENSPDTETESLNTAAETQNESNQSAPEKSSEPTDNCESKTEECGKSDQSAETTSLLENSSDSAKREECESDKDVEDESQVADVEDKVDTEKVETDNKILNNNTNSELKASENITEEVKSNSDPDQDTKAAKPNETIEDGDEKTETGMEVCLTATPINNVDDEDQTKVPVEEPHCVKETVYVCGKINDTPEDLTESETEKEEPDKEEIEVQGVNGDDTDPLAEENEPTNGTEEVLVSDNDKTIIDEPSIEEPTNDVESVENAVSENEEPTSDVAGTLRPIKKAVRTSALRKSTSKPADGEEDDETKGHSVEESMANDTRDANELSPGHNEGEATEPNDSVASKNDAVEVELTSTADATISSLSLDFTVSETAEPIKPTLRSLRKRGHEIAPVKPQEPDDGTGKRMKLKGRRQVDTALRKSVEQRIEQLHGSSSDSKDSEEEVRERSKISGRYCKKKSTQKESAEDSKSPVSEAKKPSKRDPAKKNSRILAGLDVEESCDRPQLRQSRRIAQLKIKEQAEGKSVKPLSPEMGKKKKFKIDEKNEKAEKRKRDKKAGEEVVSEPEEKTIGRRKKKRREKPASQIFNEKRPWQSSSEDSEEGAEEDEEEEEEIIEEDDDPPLGPLKSDHEFSPESEEEDDDDWQPLKRARTARKESDAEEVDDFPCQKCEKSDHPEWILLCDKCDNGWHCSCLRPPLLGIPEGDWFCPPCEHIILLERLQEKLVEYDKKLSKKEIEDRRKERLAYVGISLNNVLPNKDRADHRKKKRRHSSDDVSYSSSDSESRRSVSESETDDSDEPIYQLRQRRQTKSYKFNEYDEMIKDAIGEDVDKPVDTAGNLGRGKDIQTIVKGLEPEPKSKEENNEGERSTAAHLKKMLRKKHRKLNCLDFDSEEEDISDEDFKGSSSESEEEEEITENSEDSDDYIGRKRRKNVPTRRSTRTRTKRYDEDFINDDSDDEPPRRKKKKSIWDDSETEESDFSDHGGKPKGGKKKKKHRDDSDGERGGKKSRPRIKYGGLTSSDDESLGRGRRTRGKKTTYVDTLGSDTEEEVLKKNPRKIISDDDEDFVANEEDVSQGEEEERDSVKEAEEEEEDEEEEPSEEERPVKPPLIVPKIYIKKPLGAKKPTLPAQDTAAKPQDQEDVVDNTSKPEQKQKKDVLKQEKLEAVEGSKPAVVKPKQHETVKEALKSDILARLSQSEVRVSSVSKMTSDQVKREQDYVEELQPSVPEDSDGKSKLLASALQVPASRPRKPSIVHEPIVSNVTALIKNDDENDDLSEPPGISLPLFDELAPESTNSKDTQLTETPKKRRGRGPAKKKLEEPTNMGNNVAAKSGQPAMEIAAPPQPFSQAQPTPSVITRMLQSKPGLSIYPVGRIRPKQFATMRDDDSDECSPKNSPASSPGVSRMGGVPNQYTMPGAPRGTAPMPYRHHGPPHPGMIHYPRGPPAMRVPPPHPYGHHQSHRPLDPSPSGGGPINLADPSSGPAPSNSMPISHDTGRRGVPINRYPHVSQAPTLMTSPRPPPMHLHQQPYRPPPVSSNGPPQQSFAPPPTSSTAPAQPYAPPPAPTNGLPQPYAPPPVSNSGPAQSYVPPPSASNGPPYGPPPPPPPTSSSGPPQSYAPLPSANSGPPPQPYVVPPPSSGGPPPPHQHPYPSPPISSNGSQPPMQSQPRYPPPTPEGGPPPSESYYGTYPAAGPNEETLPPVDYEGMPPEAGASYQEPYGGESQASVNEPSDPNEGKAYDEESGGEFAGLASYFSSQREDDLES